VSVSEAVAVPEPVTERDCVWLGLPDGDGLVVTEPVGDSDAVCVCDRVPETLGVPVADGDAETDRVCVKLGLTDCDGEAEPDADPVGVRDCVWLSEGVSVWLGVGDVEAVAVCVALPEDEPLSELDAVGDGVPESLGVPVCVADAVDVPEKVCDALAVSLGVAVGLRVELCVAVPLADGEVVTDALDV